MDLAASGRISVVATSMSPVPIDQALHDDGSCVEAWFPGVDRGSSSHTELAPVILLPMSVGPTSRGRSGHSTPIITIVSVTILVTSILASLTPWRRSRAVSRLNRIRSDGSTVNPVA